MCLYCRTNDISTVNIAYNAFEKHSPGQFIVRKIRLRFVLFVVAELPYADCPD